MNCISILVYWYIEVNCHFWVVIKSVAAISFYTCFKCPYVHVNGKIGSCTMVYIACRGHMYVAFCQSCLERNLIIISSKLFSNGGMGAVGTSLRPPPPGVGVGSQWLPAGPLPRDLGSGNWCLAANLAWGCPSRWYWRWCSSGGSENPAGATLSSVSFPRRTLLPLGPSPDSIPAVSHLHLDPRLTSASWPKTVEMWYDHFEQI